MEGLRENLTDVIYNISPMETPFSSGLKRIKATQTLHEWQTDELAAADGDNAQLEGDDATFTTPAATTRVGNYTQISRKTLVLSGTLEAVDKAGRKKETAYQIAKRGKELKRDVETIMLRSQGGDGGGAGTARRLAAMPAWPKTNTVFQTGGTPAGADPTWTSGVPGAARTDDNTGEATFTETMLKTAIQSAWTEGGSPNVIMAGAHNKQNISGFSGIASPTVDVTKKAPTFLVAAVDVYVSDFGNLRVVPNRFQRARDVWGIDYEYLAMPVLRNVKTEKLAKTGDAEKRQMIFEYTLKVGNEAAHFGIFDLETS